MKTPLFKAQIDFEKLVAIKKDAEAIQGLRAKKTQALLAKYDYPEKTLDYYVAIAAMPTDVLEALRDGKISLSQLGELAQTRLGDGKRDWLARKVVERGYTTTQIRQIVKLIYKGHAAAVACSVAEGKTDEPGRVSSKDQRTLRHLVDEIVKLGFEYRGRMKLAFDFMPRTAIVDGSVRQRLIEDAYLMRHAVKEMLSSMDGVMEELIRQAEEHLAARSQDITRITEPEEPKPEQSEVEKDNKEDNDVSVEQ